MLGPQHSTLQHLLEPEGGFESCIMKYKYCQSNYSIIGVTLNTKLDTLWLSQVGGPMEGLTKKYDTSPES